MSRKRFYILLAGFLLAGYAWLGWNVVAGSGPAHAPTVCLFKTVTGFPCPSCGATRGVVLLTGGEIGESLRTNPLGAALALALAFIPLWVICDVLRRRDSLFRFYSLTERRLTGIRWVSAALATLVLVNWIWNIGKGL